MTEREAWLHTRQPGDQVLVTWRGRPEWDEIKTIERIDDGCIRIVGEDVGYDQRTGLRHSFGSPSSKRLEPPQDKEIN